MLSLLALWIALAEPMGFVMPPSAVIIEGDRVAVAWSDGDSFRFMEGKFQRQQVRLMGFNALESYGPVHRWGTWTPFELFKVTKAATRFARNHVWHCQWDGKKDHYGRMLLFCADLIEAMVREGYGHVYALKPPVDEKLLALQADAVKRKVGLWAKGAPKGIVTSLHSVNEQGGGKDKAYNRVIDTVTGLSTEHRHETVYAACEEVCIDGSCLIYVPFEKRYGPDREGCLRTRDLW